MRRPFEHPHKQAERLRQFEEEDRSNDLLSGKLNSPYGYMSVFVEAGNTNSAKTFYNGHPVKSGKLIGCDDTHKVPEHWIVR